MNASPTQPPDTQRAVSLGIDVARWQKGIVWTCVWGSEPVLVDGRAPSFPEGAPRRITFAYVKATHGMGSDPEFDRNRDKILDSLAKRPERREYSVGVYTWFVPTQDSVEQADFFIERAGPLLFALQQMSVLVLPYGVDLEDDAGGRVRGSRYHALARSCGERIEERTRSRILPYTGKWFMQQIGDVEDDWLASHELWHSEYPGRIPGPSEHGHLPKIWAERNVVETVYQHDGDKGLFLSAECNEAGVPLDSDFSRLNGTAEDFVARSKIGDPADPIDLGTGEGDFRPQTDPHTALPDIFLTSHEDDQETR